MKLEKTIQTMFDGYPDLFQDRIECLNHLFCTIGNGYDWKKGQLVSCERRDKKFTGQLGDDGKAVQRKGKTYDFDVYTDRNTGKIHLYPICRRYSALVEYPEDIRKDWLLGIKEMMEFIISSDNIANEEQAFNEVSKEEIIRLYKEKFGSDKNE